MAMSVDVKRMENQNAVVLEKYKLDAEEQRAKSEELSAVAETNMVWAIRLAFIPVGGTVASPSLVHSAEGNRVESIAA